ncbi:glutathione synthetase [Capsaspora owczarzaki ATCC 30864]|uniref:glutathione synthase n=1 Tax=Capsaspora owczarzaki (strain ATCC 30864) TaxID=595528 RepID=A0A0D2WVY7_CAPO3|nr:glutathione synthetase [Capsaspora owczarzaki ATCC 30864]KJE96528.1 glutathione synthetase [Capsaspora owczarzaki ATCC 30864]|eukprot:XP_004344458.1 glutathione synthetase [Capsaspora owczarzaki ATCC 30864]
MSVDPSSATVELAADSASTLTATPTATGTATATATATTATGTATAAVDATLDSSWYAETYPVPEVHEAFLYALVEQAKDYALTHGIVMTPKLVMAMAHAESATARASSASSAAGAAQSKSAASGGHPSSASGSGSSSVGGGGAAGGSASAASVAGRPGGGVSVTATVTHAPFTLFPSPIPAAELKRAQALQPHFNELIHRVSQSPEFLASTLAEAAESDVFTAHLLSILKTVSAEEKTQKVVLGIHRADYMLHADASLQSVAANDDGEEVASAAAADDAAAGDAVHAQKRRRVDREGDAANDQSDSVATAVSTLPDARHRSSTSKTPRLKQVEINTIAASFGGLGSITTRMHEYIMSRHNFKSENLALPENVALAKLAEGMAQAWRLYNKPGAVIMMVVQPGEHNSYDQRWMEHTLWERYHVKMIRQTLTEIYTYAILDDVEKALWVDAREVAVAYFRAGYSPLDYPTEDEWDGRLLIERSRAIKCPNIGYHLAGTKKVQQALSTHEALAQFISDPEVISDMLSVFMGLYSLSPHENGDAIVKTAIEQPHKFVLKPQREGGGNNLYGEDLQRALTVMTAQQRSAHILMDRITPPKVANYIVRHGLAQRGEIVSELGIYGVFIADDSRIIKNEAAGHLLRSKLASFDDGGVAAGVAALDSPFPV